MPDTTTLSTAKIRLEAKHWRKANNKDLYCLWCGKEIGEWSDCQCHASHWRPARQMTAADLGLGGRVMPDTTTLAEIKISELPIATSANTTDQLEANQAGITRSITVAQIAALSPPPDLSDYVTDEELAAAIGAIPPPPTTLPPSGAAGGALSGTYPNPGLAVPYPATLPPNGPAGGALSGTYPNPALVGGPLSSYALSSSIPTTLPPNGAAGGDLSGTYPSPKIKPSVTNGQVLTTVAGVAAWAAPAGVTQTVFFETGAVATGTTAIPPDDTIPQITEGDQYMQLAITPLSATSKLIIKVTMYLASTITPGNTISAALFQDSTANALAAGVVTTMSTSAMQLVTFTHAMVSGTTSSTTFKVRAGANVGGTYTTTFNGQAGARVFGGVMASSIVIREVP